MTIIPVNGKNERMSALFDTPKHLLLVDGQPAIERTVAYMKQMTSGKVEILAGKFTYFDALYALFPDDVFAVDPTDNVVETIRQQMIYSDEDLWIIDCDIVPIKLNPPEWNTVYCFDNDNGPNQYSNFLIKDGRVIDCNEKVEKYRYAGAGVYYFNHASEFWKFSDGCKSISEVFAVMLQNGEDISADTTSEIFRLGTLPDITGGFTGNIVQRTVTKTGPTIGNELKWYIAYEDRNDIPTVSIHHQNDEKVLTLDFIERDSILNVYEVYNITMKYRFYAPLNTLEFQVYRDRIATHLLGNPGITNGDKLLKELNYVTIPFSFCHGDLSVTNIIPTKKGLKLIDPLYSEDKFGSYILDYAKFLFSLKFYNNDIANYNLFRSLIQDHPRLDVLIASECVRVATYNKKFNFIAENLIAEL